VRRNQPTDALDELGDEQLRREDRLERLERDLRSRKIAEHDEGATEADVHRDDEAVLRAHVQHRRAAARAAWPVAPSYIVPASISSWMIDVTTPRPMFMRRARSARDTG